VIAHNKIEYRPDIDGLRAIAVTSVVLYHLFPGIMRGGFIGVDIFFVISGYLISKIILTELQTEQFSFINFYARRIKRIFPALIFVSALFFIYGFFVLFPNEFKMLGKHLSGAAIFLSNLTLYREGGYFDFSSDHKPFLHLWSLAVEEQFYLVWPFFLWGAWKFIRSKKMFLICISVVTILSYTLNFVLAQKNPSLAFYFPGCRLWEMSAGALIAHLHIFKGQLNSHHVFLPHHLHVVGASMALGCPDLPVFQLNRVESLQETNKWECIFVCSFGSGFQ